MFLLVIQQIHRRGERCLWGERQIAEGDGNGSKRDIFSNDNNPLSLVDVDPFLIGEIDQRQVKDHRNKLDRLVYIDVGYLDNDVGLINGCRNLLVDRVERVAEELVGFPVPPCSS